MGDLPDTLRPLPYPWPLLSYLRTTLARIPHITNLDFADAIDYYDHPNTLFFLDPPWVGAPNYEYNIDGRHRELIEKAQNAQGKYLGILSTSHSHLDDVKGVPYVYLFRTTGFLRNLVFSSIPLSEHKRLKSIDLVDYGIET